VINLLQLVSTEIDEEVGTNVSNALFLKKNEWVSVVLSELTVLTAK